MVTSHSKGLSSNQRVEHEPITFHSSPFVPVVNVEKLNRRENLDTAIPEVVAGGGGGKGGRPTTYRVVKVFEGELWKTLRQQLVLGGGHQGLEAAPLALVGQQLLEIGEAEAAEETIAVGPDAPQRRVEAAQPLRLALVHGVLAEFRHQTRQRLLLADQRIVLSHLSASHQTKK